MGSDSKSIENTLPEPLLMLRSGLDTRMIAAKVTLINSLLRINQIGALKAPRIFPAFHARKMVVHPCTTREGLINQTFPNT